MTVKSYKDLDVFREADHFTHEIYNVTAQFPKEELYGITSQLRRAALSVPANIAEGSTRGHTKELIQFLLVSKGSLAECEYYLTFASKRGYLSENKASELSTLIVKIGKMLSGLIRSLRGQI